MNACPSTRCKNSVHRLILQPTNYESCRNPCVCVFFFFCFSVAIQVRRPFAILLIAHRNKNLVYLFICIMTNYLMVLGMLCYWRICNYLDWICIQNIASLHSNSMYLDKPISLSQMSIHADHFISYGEYTNAKVVYVWRDAHCIAISC